MTRRAHGTGSITPLPGGGYQVAIEAGWSACRTGCSAWKPSPLDAVSEGLDVYAPNY